MLCVIVKLDSHATEKLRTLQKVAASYGVVPSALYGHITIAAYTPDNDIDFVIGCKKLLQGVGPFSVLFDKVEVLSETFIIVATPQKIIMNYELKKPVRAMLLRAFVPAFYFANSVLLVSRMTLTRI